MKSLRGQLTARLLWGGALLLGVGGVFLYLHIRQALTGQFDAALETRARSLAAMTEQHGSRIKMESEDAPDLGSTRDKEFFSITTLDGRAVAEAGTADTDTAVFPATTTLDHPVFFDLRARKGRNFRCVEIRFTPRFDDEESDARHPSVEAVVTFGRSRADLDLTLEILGGSLLAGCAGMLAALVLVVRWGVSSALKPLEHLGKRVEAMSAESLSDRIPTGSLPSELRPIMDRFNELFARLEATFARERRFTDSVSHELRTPLAELRSLAEVNLTTPATDAERLDSFRDVLVASSRMESLALRLLELTRTEDVKRALKFEQVSLTSTVADAWKPYASRADGRGMRVSFEVPAEMEVCTDATILLAILDNLFANAVAHAPHGSPLFVKAWRVSTAVQFTFENTAETLTDADVSRLFERFWRKDTARSDSSHHGLGLSLAAEFAAILGGRLTARLAGDHQLEFLLTIPIQCSSQPLSPKA